MILHVSFLYFLRRQTYKKLYEAEGFRRIFLQKTLFILSEVTGERYKSGYKFFSSRRELSNPRRELLKPRRELSNSRRELKNIRQMKYLK